MRNTIIVKTVWDNHNAVITTIEKDGDIITVSVADGKIITTKNGVEIPPLYQIRPYSEITENGAISGIHQRILDTETRFALRLKSEIIGYFNEEITRIRDFSKQEDDFGDFSEED